MAQLPVQLPVDGLGVGTANVVVRGLVINRFPFDGIDDRAGGRRPPPAARTTTRMIPTRVPTSCISSRASP